MQISDRPVPSTAVITTFTEPVLGQAGVEALAPMVCSLFARWCAIEKQLDQIHTIITGNDAQARTDFERLRGWDRQKSAIISAATDLHPDAVNMTRAVLNLADAPARKRHDLAHGVWATAEGFDDHLVLLSPDSQRRMGEAIVASKAAGTTRIPIDNTPMHAESRLVDAHDLGLALEEMEVARRRLDDLMYGFLYPPFADVTGDGFADSRTRLADDQDVSLQLRNIEVSQRQAERTARRANE